MPFKLKDFWKSGNLNLSTWIKIFNTSERTTETMRQGWTGCSACSRKIALLVSNEKCSRKTENWIYSQRKLLSEPLSKYWRFINCLFVRCCAPIGSMSLNKILRKLIHLSNKTLYFMALRKDDTFTGCEKILSEPVLGPLNANLILHWMCKQ